MATPSVPPRRALDKRLLLGCGLPAALVAVVGTLVMLCLIVGGVLSATGMIKSPTPTVLAARVGEQGSPVAALVSVGGSPTTGTSALAVATVATPTTTATVTLSSATATAFATIVPTSTQRPATATSAPATATSVPPTATSVPATATSVPPTPIPPTATAVMPALALGELIGVADGATIRVRLPDGSEPFILLIGVDAPLATECYGDEATARTTALLQGRTVELEADQADSDKGGRLLRYVWVWGEDGVRRHVNLELAQDGFAGVYDATPNSRYRADLAAAQQRAQAQKKGLWGECGKVHMPRKVPTATATPRPVPTATIAPTAPPAPVAPAPTATTAPAVPAAPATGGVTFVSVVGGGINSTASATVQTTPGATCAITYVTPLGTVSEAQGLDSHVAGANGRASWSWKIGPSTRPGTGSVTVRCGGASATAPITIR